LPTDANFRFCNREIYVNATSSAPLEYTWFPATHHIATTQDMSLEPALAWNDAAKVLNNDLLWKK